MIRIKGFPRKDSERLSCMFSALIIMVFVTNAAAMLETQIHVSHHSVSVVLKFIIGLLFICNLGAIIRCIDKRTVLLLLTLSLIMTLNCLLLNDTQFFIKTVSEFLINVLPVAVIVSCIKQYDDLVKKIYSASIFVIALSIIVVVISDRSNAEYSMGYSNSLVIPIIALLYHYYIKHNITNILIALIGIIEIIMIGSRGALLGIGTFVILLLIKQMISSNNRGKKFAIISISIMTICAVNYNLIVTMLYNLASQLGYHSRTLWLIVNDSITHDSRRIQIYQQMIEEIQRNPFTMRGIAGEYVITNGGYSHNFVLELLIDFGVVIGGLLVILIILKAVHTLINGIKKEDSYSMVSLILFSASFPEALVSGSFWISAYLWAWLLFGLWQKRTIEKRYRIALI